MKFRRKTSIGFEDTRDRFALRYAAKALRKRHTFPTIVPICLDLIKRTPPEILDQDGQECLRQLFSESSDKNDDETVRDLEQFFASNQDSVASTNNEILLDRLIHALQKPSNDDGNDSLFPQVGKNVSFMSELLDLTANEEHLIFVVNACRYSRALDDLADELLAKLKSASDTVSCLLDISREEAHKITLPDRTLRRSGVLLVDEGDYSFYGWFKLLPRLERILARPYESSEQLQKALVGEPRFSELKRNDFSHLDRDQGFLVRLLKGAVEREASGINILIHGPPGTGKTEFAKVAAAEAGLALYPAGEEDEKGFEPLRGERLQDLLLLQNMLCINRRGVVLVDEAEDLFEWNIPVFRGNSSGTGSKVYLNRLLEENNRPIIWIVNDVDSLPVRVRRRMTFSIRMGIPPSKVRARVWQRMAESENLSLAETDADHLADFLVPPGIGANALQAAALSDGNLQDVEHAITGIQKSLSGAGAMNAGARRNTSCLDLRLFNADTDLSSLLERLAETERRDISFCLYGPPGTGKTEFAYYLAETLGMDVLEKRASDLLGPYVGQTESSIAKAFQEAWDRDAVLVFDEADSLLSDRKGAHQRFEITQVNEMLSQLERHPLPFVCTTNLMERIDPASLRRFTFKLKFSYLSADGLQTGFKRYFNMEAPKGLFRFHNCTPGDLSTISRKAQILGLCDKPDALVQLLNEEVSYKNDDVQNPIGF